MQVEAGSQFTDQPQTVSVVICAFTTERWTQLQDAVASVLDQEPAPDEVLVVMSRHVGQSSDRWPAADCGVGAVVIVDVEPVGQGGVALC